jgi:hypothetical protein
MSDWKDRFLHFDSEPGDNLRAFRFLNIGIGLIQAAGSRREGIRKG